MEFKEYSEALDINQQINNLKLCNLKISDEETAKVVLNEISYYRLIKAYGSSFKNKKGQYVDNRSFEDILNVYKFDDELRLLLIPYLQKIEIVFLCRISNYFCCKYGVLGYLVQENFNERCDFKRLSDKIRADISMSDKNPIVRNFQNNYVNREIPLYAAVEVFSFGTLAMFYSCMKNLDKNAIAERYENVNGYYLSSWLHSISHVRNLCFHYGRLYKRTLVKKPKMLKKLDGDIENGRIYAVLCCMRYLYKEFGDWASFVNGFQDIINEYKDCIKPAGLGCPNNWYEKLLDQEDDLSNLFRVL